MGPRRLIATRFLVLSYKPIDDVMERQNDLAEPVHRLRQVLNIKG